MGTRKEEWKKDKRERKETKDTLKKRVAGDDWETKREEEQQV